MADVEVGGHYYIDPGTWDTSNVEHAARMAAFRTNSAQRIHAHSQLDPDTGLAIVCTFKCVTIEPPGAAP